MRTYTIAEAAPLTELSARALRARVDRGQIRSVLRDGARRIPHTELERAGLLQGSTPDTTEVIRELTAKLDAQAAELAQLRALPERIEAERSRHDEQLAREAQARAEAERRAEAAEERASEEGAAVIEAQTAAQAARDWRERAARAGWRERRRMLREARGAQAA